MELNFVEIAINVVILVITFVIGFKVGKNFDKETVFVEKETPKPESPVYTAKAVEVPPKKSKTAAEQAQDVFNEQFKDITLTFEKDILSSMQRGEYSFNSFSALYNKLPKEATMQALRNASNNFHKANPALELDATFSRHHNRGHYVQCIIKFRESQ